MFKEIKILSQHGIQYVPDLKGAILTPLFRGRPVIQDNITSAEAEMIQKLCPSDAIVRENGFGIDLGKCVFCKECSFACPDKIEFTNDYKIASNDRNNLIVRSGDTGIKFNEEILRPDVRKFFKNSLKLRQVSAGGDSSCEIELNAAGNVNFDMGRFGIEFVASPRHADGVVITGPITENMAEALQICYDAIPAPKIIILVGTDAISGGIFENSPAIKREFLEKYQVDLYMPGNPTHPLTFINGILSLIGK
ncbi:MAG: NADH:ubiquinone oxidoreductase [Candidatus Delongbacteria bacterium]|jgi:Ni,Fe-hydrogenase III small subunit/NAD-dependent dihydropyrimidine dehydrogenase PreA subunit|nr:NADH:ubiquinone oxidoreductase [Candidatus Delongbacteria bacterium]